MKNVLTSLAVAAAVLTAPAAHAADKLLLKTPIAFSTALPGLGTPIPRVADQLDLMSGGTLKMKVYEPGKLVDPFEILDPIIWDLDLTICLDYGHLILQGDDIDTFLKTYSAKTAIIHIYGVAENHFHMALDRLPEKLLAPLMGLLANFKGPVSMEVFSYADLNASLKFMEKCWGHQQGES